MKVILVNGSPNVNGCTYTALQEIAKTLNQNDIATEIFWIGNKYTRGCIDCDGCKDTHHCVFGDDKVNEFIDLAKEADGFIFGSPVYFGSANGSLVAFMDRVFYASEKDVLYLKPAAAIASARRAGTDFTCDELNRYFALKQMPIITSKYWNIIFGNTPDEVRQDAEGLQIMRTLARNMAFFLKCKQAGLKAGVELPQSEEPLRTNFIR